MLLQHWISEQGPGVITRLHHKTGLSYTAIHKAVRGTTKPRYDTAQRIAAATDGLVSAGEVYPPTLPNGSSPSAAPSSSPPPAPSSSSSNGHASKPPPKSKAPTAPKTAQQAKRAKRAEAVSAAALRRKPAAKSPKSPKSPARRR